MTDDSTLPFTGERFTPECVREIWYEHWHRYVFARRLAQGRRVLDAACGEGYGAAMLADGAVEVVGVDIDAPSIAHAREAREHFRLLLDVLERLEADDDVEARIGEIERGRIGFLVAQVRPRAVALACVRDRRIVEIDADDFERAVGEQRRSVTLAARAVEHALALNQAARERIAVPVLVPDLAHALGREAFAGERQGEGIGSGHAEAARMRTAIFSRIRIGCRRRCALADPAVREPNEPEFA